MTNTNPNPATRFGAGNNGRPKGSRNKLGSQFVENLSADFDEHGAAVIQRVRLEDPTAYFTTIARLLPKELSVAIEQRLPGNLDPDSWATLRRVIDLVEQFAPAGADPLTVFETIERALVTTYAQPEPLALEHKPSLPMPMETVAALPPPPYR
jgi:hypothetical protein